MHCGSRARLCYMDLYCYSRCGWPSPSIRSIDLFRFHFLPDGVCHRLLDHGTFHELSYMWVFVYFRWQELIRWQSPRPPYQFGLDAFHLQTVRWESTIMSQWSSTRVVWFLHDSTLEYSELNQPYETVILFLTLYSGYKRFRHSATPLLVILYRDGVLFFSLLFGKVPNLIRCRPTSVLIYEQRSPWETSLPWLLARLVSSWLKNLNRLYL